jgi:hypothetical protein
MNQGRDLEAEGNHAGAGWWKPWDRPGWSAVRNPTTLGQWWIMRTIQDREARDLFYLVPESTWPGGAPMPPPAVWTLLRKVSL